MAAQPTAPPAAATTEPTAAQGPEPTVGSEGARGATAAQEPDAALAALAAFDGPVLVDFDETLYLRNSTEDFIDSAVPGLLAMLLLRLLDLLRPWRWTGGDASRDWWRVRVISLAMPWVWLRWRRRAAKLARSHVNEPLARALRAHRGEQWIVSIGFLPIILPMARALGYAPSRVVAARLDTPADRIAGKLVLATAEMGHRTLREAMVVTDSESDAPLLAECRAPLLVRWPGARYCHALSRVYLPGLYLTLIKRPGERYIWTGILQEDFAFWALGSVGLAALPFFHVLGLGLLLVSFWTIYERGYVDNDWAAKTLEAQPKLSHNYGVVEVATPRIQPWLWAIVFALGGIGLIRWPNAPTAGDLIAWTAVLFATAIGFWLYNRVDKSTRIWLFTGLQAARSMAFLALVPVPVATSLALGAHILARWVPYYSYRIAKVDWPNAPFFLCRLSFFVVLCVVVACSQDWRDLFGGTLVALLGWNLFRARKELLAAVRAARWLPNQRKAP